MTACSSTALWISSVRAGSYTYSINAFMGKYEPSRHLPTFTIRFFHPEKYRYANI